jgi:hypothetical protein
MNSELKSLIKRGGIIAMAKAIASDGDSRDLTEHEFTDLITSHVLLQNPRLSGAQAFAKAFTDPSPEGALLRQAYDVVRRRQFAESEHDDSAEAIAELRRIGKQRWPSLKPHQRFSRALETNIDLAKRACRRPAPTTSFPFPH